MKRTTQRPRTASKLPHVLEPAEAARVKGGATAIEYGLMLTPTAVEHAVTRPGMPGSD